MQNYTMDKKIESAIRAHAICRYHAMKEIIGEVRYKDFADGIRKSYAEYDVKKEVESALFYVGSGHNFSV